MPKLTFCPSPTRAVGKSSPSRAWTRFSRPDLSSNLRTQKTIRVYPWDSNHAHSERPSGSESSVRGRTDPPIVEEALTWTWGPSTAGPRGTLTRKVWGRAPGAKGPREAVSAGGAGEPAAPPPAPHGEATAAAATATAVAARANTGGAGLALPGHLPRLRSWGAKRGEKKKTNLHVRSQSGSSR